MKRLVWVGAAVLVLAGCAQDAAVTAVQPSTSTSVAAASTTVPQPVTAVEPSTPTADPVVSETAVPAAPTGEPPPTEPVSDDMPHGEQLYRDTCTRFKAAIDAVALTGAASRDQSVTGLREKLQEGPSWSTLSADDQQQILRGLDAAGRGSC